MLSPLAFASDLTSLRPPDRWFQGHRRLSGRNWPPAFRSRAVSVISFLLGAAASLAGQEARSGRTRRADCLPHHRDCPEQTSLYVDDLELYRMNYTREHQAFT